MDVVISDLDGTLLDHSSYSFGEARPGLDLLKSKRIPLVYCSSKTRTESDYWRRVTENHHPFIVENGGAVVIPPEYFHFAIPSVKIAGRETILQLGDSYADLVETLESAVAESGCAVRSFHQMTTEEVAQACDLSVSSAALAKEREFDEPFLILDTEGTAALLTAIERRGKRWTRGGRFYHILGKNDKASAVAALLDLYRHGGQAVRSIGIGDGLNDAAFLNIVDIPNSDPNTVASRTSSCRTQGKPTQFPGPLGWGDAMLRLFG